MSNVQITSVHAYREALLSGRLRTYRERVAAWISATGPRTRQELSVGLGLGVNLICRPVLTLIESGELEILRERRCQITGMMAQELGLVEPAPVQRKFELWAR